MMSHHKNGDRYFWVLYYFRVLFPIALMFWINNYEINRTYIEMQRPGILYRVLIK